MNTGMLWYDPDPKVSLLEKVSLAAEFYFTRYGQRANACYVHPSAVAGDAQLVRIGSVIVRPDRQVIRGHLYIGIEQRPAEAQP